MALPPPPVDASTMPPAIPELVAVALPRACATASTLPVLLPALPELFAVALPPLVVNAVISPLRLMPVLVVVALPPPSVCDVNPLAVPELVVVAFWFAPAASLVKAAAAVPEFVQLMSLGVIVQTNCAEAGEPTKNAIKSAGKIAMDEDVAARQNVARNVAAVPFSESERRCIRIFPLPRPIPRCVR